MVSRFRLSGALLCSFLLFGCLDKDNEVTVARDGSIVRQVNPEISILAPVVRQIAEQTEHSIKAKVSATNGVEPIMPNVSWELVDAPDGFDMALSWSELDGDETTVEFITPDIDENTQVTVRLVASVDESNSVHAMTQSHDILLDLSANGEITISGAVVDDPIPHALVTIKVGEQTFEITADANGLYSVPVEFADANAVVEVTAVGAPGSGFEAVEFKSYLGDGNSLMADAGDDGVLTASENININVSNVTTAVYVLVQEIIEEQSDEDAPVQGVILDQQQFDELVEQVDNEEVIQVAAVIQLVVDYGADLPENTNTVLDLVEDLIKDEAAKEEFVEESIQQVIAENSDIDELSIDDLVEDIIEDENLVASPSELEFTEHFVLANTVRTSSSLFKRAKLLFGDVELNENKTGTVRNFLTAGDRSLTWAVEGTQLLATFDVEVVLGNDLYDVPDGYNLFITGFSVNQLAKTDVERNWLVRVRGEYRNGNAAQTQQFRSESVSITARTINNIAAYSDDLLVDTNRYLTVVDNTSAESEDSFYNAASHLLSFSAGNVGQFTSANGQTVPFTWSIGDLGRLTVNIAGVTGVPQQTLTYARFKQATNSIAYISAMQVRVDGNTYAFTDITFNPAQGTKPDGFTFQKTYKYAGSDNSFTLLTDNTGFYYNPTAANKFSHFTYAVSNDVVTLTNYGSQGRKCVVGTQCSVVNTATLSFEHFAEGRLTLHQSVVHDGTTESSIAIAKSVRDVVFTTSSVPANLNLYLAETQATHSYFFNADGTGLVNAGSNEGACSAITWQVSSNGRLVVNDGTESTLRLLVGSTKQGLVWQSNSTTGRLFTTTSNINSCAAAVEQFTPIERANMTFGNYRFTDSETGNRLVIRFNEDGSGYFVNGNEYYNEQYANQIDQYLKATSWNVNNDGRIVLAVDMETPIEITISLIDNTLTSGQVKFARDTNGDGTLDETLLFESSLVKGCNKDLDGDGISNCFDKDDDGDGTEDQQDVFPLDPNESKDFDQDGTGDNADTDDDNDGVLDENDADPFNPDVGEAKAFTSQAFVNKVFVETAQWKAGTVPGSATTLAFDTSSAKVTEVTYSYSSNQSDYQWQIIDGVLVLTTSDLSLEDTVYYPYQRLADSYGFSQEVVDELVMARDNGDTNADYVVVSYGKVRREMSLVDDSVNGKFDVAVVTDWQYLINSPDDYVISGETSLTESGSVSNLMLFDTAENVDFGQTVADVIGQWILPMDYQLSGEVAFAQDYNILSDVVQITSATDASGSISGRSFTVSVSNGALILTDGNEQYIYRAIYASGSVYLGTVEKTTSGISDGIVAKQIVKFDNSASTFIAGLGNEFPTVHLAHINSAYEDNWDGEQLKLENVWGYRFAPQGHLDRGVGSVIGEDNPDIGFNYFDLGQAWNWTTVNNQLFMEFYNGSDTPAFVRTWDIAATTEGGFVAVLERSQRTDDFNYDGQISADEENRWYILPRVNFIKQDDLSQWSEAWSNTLAMGALSDEDTDGDNIPNHSDDDDDNDGYSDVEEIRVGTDPQDPNSNGNDFDNDGIVDSQDNDDDNDGVLDENDIDPYNAEVGLALTLTSDNLAARYAIITASNTAKPSFNVEESGAVVRFSKTSYQFSFSDSEEYSVGSYEINDNKVTVSFAGEEDVYRTDVWELYEDGVISLEVAESYINSSGVSDVFVTRVDLGAELQLIAQSTTVDTFYLRNINSYLFTTDWQREMLTGSSDLTPIIAYEIEIIDLTKIDQKTTIPFTAAEIANQAWGLPIGVDPAADRYIMLDDTVDFTSSRLTSRALNIEGSWQINNDGQLAIDLDEGSAYVYTRYEQFDGMSSVLVELDTQLESPIEGAWVDGTGNYTMPTPTMSAGTDQAVIYYNREDDNFDGWTLHVWNNDQCSGVLGLEFGSSTSWENGLQPDGIDPNFGAYWVLDLDGMDSCINFIVHHFDNGAQTPDLEAIVSDSDTAQFFVLSLDNNDAWETTGVLPYARTYESLDIFDLIDVTLTDYRFVGQLSDDANFDGISGNPINFSWDLLDEDNYAENGERFNENFTFFFPLDDGSFTWTTGGFDINSVPNNQMWHIDASDGAIVETYYWNMVDDTVCTPENSNCAIYYQYRFTPISTVGNRTYFTGTYFFNNSVWSGTYDANANEYGTFGINYLEIQQQSDFDFDLDGMSDIWDEDDDNDGYLDYEDRFPYDASECCDFDNDGIGDNADNDDDNDGVEDSADIAPYDPEYGAKLAITETSLNKTHITLYTGRGENPGFRTSTSLNGQKLEFRDNNVFYISDAWGTATGSFTIENDSAVATFDGDSSTIWLDLESMVERGLISQSTAHDFEFNYGTQWVQFSVDVTGASYSVLEESDVDRLFWAEYHADYNVVDDTYREALFGSVDAQAVSIVHTSYELETHFESALQLGSFVTSDFNGKLAVPDVPFDEDSDGTFDSLVSDILDFDNNMSDTGKTANFTWQIVDGALHIDYGNSASVIIKKHKSFDQTHAVFVTTEYDGMTYNSYRLLVNYDATTDTSFIVNEPLLSAHTLTDLAAFEGDDVKSEEVFGFRLDAGGNAYVLVENDLNLQYHPDGQKRHWAIKDGVISLQLDRIENESGFNCRDHDSRCQPARIRYWQPLAKSGDRLYVLEWEVNNDYEWDFNAAVPQWSTRISPRINFYETYPLSIDTDGDGIFDDFDTDADNDGVDNDFDAFPLDQRDSADADGDGVGDNRDQFPNDASEQYDNDMDGIGDNADPDDDNDGIDDVNDPTPYKDTRVVADLTFTDAGFSSCLNDAYGNWYYTDVTEINCIGYEINSISGVEQLTNLTYFSLNESNDNVTDYTPLAALQRLTSFNSRSSVLDNDDLAVLATISSLEFLWLETPNVTSIEALRNHPNLAGIHFWNSSTEINVDVLLSWQHIVELAIRTESVDNFDQLGQLTSLRKLWLHGDISDQEASLLSGLTQLWYLDIGWGGQNWSETAFSVISNYSNLEELRVGDNILQDISFLGNLSLFRHLTLDDASPVELSQMDDLRNLGITVNQWLNYQYIDEEFIIGRHSIHDVENDQGELITVDVLFDSDYSGTIDWGFGDEAFDWQITDDGRVQIAYVDSDETDRWYFNHINYNDSGYDFARIGIEVDETSDGIYDSHSSQRYYIYQSGSAYVGHADVVGSHSFVNPNDSQSYEIIFNDDFTGSVTWDNGPESFTWSFDSEGRVIVDYDDVNNSEIDRWTWNSTQRHGATYHSGTVVLEVSEFGDGNFDILEFADVNLFKYIPPENTYLMDGDIQTGTIGNQVARITDNMDDDAGELRYKFANGSEILKGKFVASIRKSDNMSCNIDLYSRSANMVVYGASTSAYNAIVDLRIGVDDFSSGYSIRNKNEEGNRFLDVSNAMFEADTWTFIEINWDATDASDTQGPLVSVLINGIEIGTPWRSNSESLADVVNGAQTFVFRVGDTSSVLPECEYLVDNVKIFSVDEFGDVLAWADNFESYNHGDSLDTDNVSSPYHGNTAEVFVATEVEEQVTLGASHFIGDFQLHVVDEQMRYDHTFFDDGSGFAVWDEFEGIESFTWSFDEVTSIIEIDYGQGNLNDLYHVTNYHLNDDGSIMAIDFDIEIDDDLDGAYDTQLVNAIFVPNDAIVALGESDVIGTHIMYQLEDDVIVEITHVFNDDFTGTSEFNGTFSFTWSLDGNGSVVLHYDSETFTDKLVWRGAFYSHDGQLEYGLYELQVDNDGDGVYEEVDDSWYKTVKQ